MEGAVQGCELRGREGTAPSRLAVTVSSDPATLEPLPFAPKTKMEAPSQAGEGAASRS